MEMRNHKVGVMILEVGRNNRQHQPREATDGKQYNKRDRKEHRSFEGQRPSPHGRNPVKHLHSCRHRYQHSAIHKEQLGEDWHPSGEHMVCPYQERQDCNTARCINH
ncbi:hypothetical protein VFDL14_14170 [Vibrio fortis]|uniref:Uncharacterized protein n=1 Tax=Vibrio fortis TaxID=212667 RepID=A0A066UYN1_9VIBR|nr:hypothetical protein VFDL14_14170 [Vibrio fortis]